MKNGVLTGNLELLQFYHTGERQKPHKAQRVWGLWHTLYCEPGRYGFVFEPVCYIHHHPTEMPQIPVKTEES